MSWQTQLKGDSLNWLLEPDSPGVRYLALRDLVGLREDDPELVTARRLAHQHGPISDVLGKMLPEGYWFKPGPGYSPKYRATVWAIILLGQLGAQVAEDERIRQGCRYLLEHTLAEGGKFSYNGAPGGTIDCLQGNLCLALMELGCADARLEAAFDWMARTVTGEGIASNKDQQAEQRFYVYKCGPVFACGANGKLPCAWGAVKVVLALGKLPAEKRTPQLERALQQGVDFLLGIDPATADYPTRLGDKPSRSWWKFGFPVYYVADILQNVEALAAAGYGQDPRLANALELIRSQQDENGRWALEYDYTGWLVKFGEKKQPNKWVTLRALRVLKAAQ